MDYRKERAIILGGGFSGMLAAKVLSKFFKEVIIIERDSEIESEQIKPRKGVPQGAFNHGIIPIGKRAIDQLFPEFSDEIIRKRGGVCELLKDVRYVYDNVCKPRIKSDYTTYLASRPLLDKTLRDLLKRSCHNVVFQYDIDALGFLCDKTDMRISGVKLKNKITHQSSTLDGDLIVDTTGPHGRSVEWLEELGFKRPPIEEVQLNYIQVSYKARWKDDFSPDWSLTVFKKSGLLKGGYFMRLEDDSEGKPQWMFALVTNLGEPLEKNKESYEKFCKDLEDEAFNEAVKNATPLSEIGQYKLPKLRRKFFSQMHPLPKNLIIMGDAQCTWAPHTGLGLAMASSNALELQKVLEKTGLDNISENYFLSSEKLIARIWNQSIAQGVIPYVGTIKPSLYMKFLMWYKAKLSKYSDTDPILWRENILFFFNERTVKSLFRPAIVWRMFLHELGFYEKS